MATVEEFEVLLKEVVIGKRLSASKMEKLTEVSLKLMEDDTRLVSVLYRTHKALPANAKISSLYVFDALCRAARHQVVKRSLTGDINSEKGNCATFLLKIDAVLDGLFQDILSSGVPGAKEKTKKILDIWTKANTFPANVLTRLGVQGEVAENVEPVLKETKNASTTPTSDPRKQPTPPSGVIPPPPANTTTPTAEAAQAALLALLSSAAAAKNQSNSNQTSANIANIPAASPSQAQSQTQIGQLQFALLQQLSKNNNAGMATGMPGGHFQPQAPPVPPQLATGALNTMNFPGPSSLLPISTDPSTRSGPEHRDTWSPNDATNGRGRGNQYFDNRQRGSHPRGARGGFRGRGRGGVRGQEVQPWQRGNFEGGSAAYQRQPNSRSQSPPPRRGDSRAPYSPLRRPSLTSPIERTRDRPAGALEEGKDEFGRDIRISSEGPEDNDRGGAKEGAARGREDSTPFDMAQSDEIHNAPLHCKGSESGGKDSHGLESFDITTFDPTNAESWKALGDAFQVTHGYVPTQEELMQLIMSTMAMGMGMALGTQTDVSDSISGLSTIPVLAGSESSYMDAGSPTTVTVSGQGWDAGTTSKRAYDHGSDAVVLGSSEDMASQGEGTAQRSMSPASAGGGGGSAGQMQKIGDRWIFVRKES